MNTDPADTRYPHLDVGDLIASAAGQPIGDRPRAHLAGCEPLPTRGEPVEPRCRWGT